MTTQEKLDSLPEEERQRILYFWDVATDKSPENWRGMVNYYYELYNAVPEGWFQWWED